MKFAGKSIAKSEKILYGFAFVNYFHGINTGTQVKLLTEELQYNKYATTMWFNYFIYCLSCFRRTWGGHKLEGKLEEDSLQKRTSDHLTLDIGNAEHHRHNIRQNYFWAECCVLYDYPYSNSYISYFQNLIWLYLMLTLLQFLCTGSFPK